MASGNRNGANSTEMKASDGRTHRRAPGSLGSFISLRPRPREHDHLWSIRSALAPALSQRERGRDHPALGRARRRREGWARLPLAFALLAIFSIPARADFRVCNKTHALINIAVGTDAGEVFKTEGWWVATPGSCATPVRGPLKSRFVYLYATDIDGVDLVAGTATMCIDRGKFVAYGAENCWRRGLQAVTFAEIDTLDSSDWMTFLTDPRK
jgi:uncharacterized membrane protein